jgi:putative transposase
VYRHRYEYGARVMCKVLEVSHGGYYGFLKRRGDSIRQADLIARIREAHRRSRYTYGSRRLMHHLRKDEVEIGRYRVRHLMRLAGISVRQRRKYKTTTKSSHDLPPKVVPTTELEFRAL